VKKTPFECYADYLALRAHFTTSYSYQKYAGKLKTVSATSFKARRDMYQFQKLAKQNDPFAYMLANFVDNHAAWIGDIVSPEGEIVYRKWCKRIQSLTYTFEENLLNLDRDFNQNFVVKKGEHPFLIKQYVVGAISHETFVILVDLARCYATWDKLMDADDVIWQEVSKKYRKYRPFLTYDKSKFKGVLLHHFPKKA